MTPANNSYSGSSILDSANEFLVQALRDYKSKKLNFAVVHAVTAIELLLKERLARIHPMLVFEKIDTPKSDKSKTVSLQNIPTRLMNFGVALEGQDIELIYLLKQWRNDVVHHMPCFDQSLASKKLERLFDFFVTFSRVELKHPLKNILPPDLFKLANTILDDWKHEIARAQKTAAETGQVLSNTCPSCGAVAVLSSDSAGGVCCHLCGAEHYCVKQCSRCGRTALGKFSFSDAHVCVECVKIEESEFSDWLRQSLGKNEV
jgi:hypothetical protein